MLVILFIAGYTYIVNLIRYIDSETTATSALAIRFRTFLWVYVVFVVRFSFVSSSVIGVGQFFFLVCATKHVFWVSEVLFSLRYITLLHSFYSLHVCVARALRFQFHCCSCFLIYCFFFSLCRYLFRCIVKSQLIH